MPDNVTLPAAAGKAATREVTYSGEVAQMQTVGLGTFTGVDDAKVATDVSTTNPLPVSLDETQVDVHGQTLGVSRVVQVTAKFFQQAPSNFLNVTVSGGATATGPTAGLAVFATGTATTAALLAQTPVGVMYATQYEVWASLAGAFTTPTSAASFQRLGIYDAVNGYYFGYSGLTFGLTVRVNSVNTFVAKSSWNVDALTGAAGSKFTSGGAPVALVPTNLNMLRIRYGWYGAVTARFEVYSPDGKWVLVHQVRTANSQTTANLTAPDLPMTVEVSKTAADATNLTISCGGWGAGITCSSSGTSLSGQGSIAALNAAVVVPTTSVGALSFSITGTWVGTLSFQYSLDGLTWTVDTPLNNVTGGFTATTSVNGAFTAPVASFKFYRVVATAWTSGSASVVYNASPMSNMVIAKSLITDGFGAGPATVKPASTAAVFSDSALVVAVRPGGALVTNAAVLADAVANPTIGLQTALLAAFNGTTWDRLRSTIANGLAVDVTRSVLPTGAATEASAAGIRTDLGTDGATPPVVLGTGTGVRGWLRSIYEKLTGTLAVTGNVAVTNAGTFAAQATLAAETTKVIGTVNLSAGQTVTVAQSTAANLNLTATPIAITKGTQGATGFTTQDLKDAGRVNWSAASAIAGVTAVTVEALVTMVPQRDGTAATTATSFAVTSAKRLRITGMTVGLVSTAAAVLSGRLSLRIGAAAAATATSPIVVTLAIPSGAALAQAGGSMTHMFPDGFEISGAQQVGVTQVCSAATGSVWVSLIGYEY